MGVTDSEKHKYASSCTSFNTHWAALNKLLAMGPHSGSHRRLVILNNPSRLLCGSTERGSPPLLKQFPVSVTVFSSSARPGMHPFPL